MNKLAFFLIVCFAITACKNNTANEDKSLQQWAKDSGTILNTTATADTMQLETAPPIVAPAVPAAVNVPAKAPAQALNPAHGMPGHRCDIAVGAPLNSPAQAGQPAPQVQPMTAPIPAAVPVAPANATGKLNPPHGQPGHRCDISVGAPLNS